MFKPGKVVLTSLLGATLAGAMIAQAAHAEQAIWRASQTSGEVWITHSGVLPIALSSNESVASGDIVRTGQNGRVLLSRGEETILVSANSQIEIAPDTEVGFSTILQKVGSILLEVERRNVQHFEVQTPYLAAVVKGTKFRVTVDDSASNVEVLRGQVEVRDYRSGQVALVNPYQAARVLARGPSDLSVTGSGPLSPIQQGAPSAAPRQFVPQLNESITIPERRAETAREKLRSTDGPGPTSHKKVAADASEAFAGRTREPDEPRTLHGENSSGAGGGPSGGADRGALRGAFGVASDEADGGVSDITLSGMVKRVRESVAGDHGWNRDEDATAIVAIPAVVGVAVTLGVGMVRRRKRIKPEKDRC
jgi:hypothetical protein